MDGWKRIACWHGIHKSIQIGSNVDWNKHSLTLGRTCQRFCTGKIAWILIFIIKTLFQTFKLLWNITLEYLVSKSTTIYYSFHHGLSISGNHLIHTTSCQNSDCCPSHENKHLKTAPQVAGAGLRFMRQLESPCLIKCSEILKNCDQKFAIQRLCIIITLYNSVDTNILLHFKQNESSLENLLLWMKP